MRIAWKGSSAAFTDVAQSTRLAWTPPGVSKAGGWCVIGVAGQVPEFRPVSCYSQQWIAGNVCEKTPGELIFLLGSVHLLVTGGGRTIVQKGV